MRTLLHEPCQPPAKTETHNLEVAHRVDHTIGMTSEKIAISLPRGIAQRARQAVREGRAPSVSAYVAHALEEKAKLDELATLLDEMLAESGGPLTPAEREEADRSLGSPNRKPQRRQRRRS